MNKRNLLLFGFLAVIAAQLAVPARMIQEHEETLRTGQAFKFKTQPVDPADAFRGRYVWLRLCPDTAKVTGADTWRHDQKAFAVLGADTNGFAFVKRLDRCKPAGEPAVPVRVTDWPRAKAGEVRINWTDLDRYYMEEGKAPTAEAAYRKYAGHTNVTCYAAVRVRGTHAVIENLFIEDQPIRAWLLKHPKK